SAGRIRPARRGHRGAGPDLRQRARRRTGRPAGPRRGARRRIGQRHRRALAAGARRNARRVQRAGGLRRNRDRALSRTTTPRRRPVRYGYAGSTQASTGDIHMRPIHTLFLAPAILALAACGPSTEPTTDADVTTPPVAPVTPAEVAGTAAVEAQVATAMLEPTEGNETRGELRFEAANGHVRVTGRVTGLNPGAEHGFHVHEAGDCSAPDATSAGGHFNPGDS